MPSTQYMGLALPTPGVTVGTWGTTENAAFTLIDSHNHTSGQGVQVPTAGLNINADLPFGGTNATTLRSARFNSQSAVLALATDIDCVYVSGGDLYYNNASGTAVQITSGGALAASSLGGISGMGGTTASVSYNSTNKTFTFWSNTNTGGTIDGGSVVIRSPSTNNGATMQVPSSLAASYALTLLASLPASTLPLSCSSGGTLTAAQITRVQIADVGQQTSSAITTNSSSGTATTTVSTLTVTITTVGRPVIVMLVPSGGSGGVTVQGSTGGPNGPTGADGTVIIDRDSAAQTWTHLYSVDVTVVAPLYHPLPPPIVDAVAAGTHTYVVKIRGGTGLDSNGNPQNGTITISRAKLVAYEL